MNSNNLSIVLAERPTTNIVPGQTFHKKVTAAPTPDQLKDGEILVEVLVQLSNHSKAVGSRYKDAYILLTDARSYIPPVQIGAVMRGATACRVLASKSGQAKAGDFVHGETGWTEYAILSHGGFEPASHYPGLNEPSDMLSVLGLTGLTAWVGMSKIGEPRANETVVVSGAAGATGSVAGQIAKIKGSRVIGIAGSQDKCEWLVNELGFDAALNYKDKDFRQKFKEATPKYIDVYFDNVGGDILNMCLARAKPHARFVMCGGISQYNTDKPEGPSNIAQVISMRIKMQGFIVFDHTKDFPNARKELSSWLAQGKLKKSEHILRGGLDVAEQGLVDLYKGVNTGKLLVEIKSPNKEPSKL